MTNEESDFTVLVSFIYSDKYQIINYRYMFVYIDNYRVTFLWTKSLR